MIDLFDDLVNLCSQPHLFILIIVAHISSVVQVQVQLHLPEDSEEL